MSLFVGKSLSESDESLGVLSILRELYAYAHDDTVDVF